MLIQTGEEKRKKEKAEEIAYKTWESKKSVNDGYRGSFEQEYRSTLSKMEAQERNSTRWKKRGKKLPSGVR